MQTFLLQGHDLLPTIHLDPQTGSFLIEGKSLPPDGKAFYDPVLKWLDEYCKNPCEMTHLTLSLDYFNISTSKMLLFILYKMNELRQNGYDVSVSWIYAADDDEMYEAGEDYAFMVQIPFELCPVFATPRAS